MRRSVRSAGDGGADPDKPEERLDCGNGVQAAAIGSCTEAGSDRAEDDANNCAEAAVSYCATAASSDCTTATGSNYAEAVDEFEYAAGHECTTKWVADDCTGAVCTCTNADAGHVYV
jgi:hypothetical protein